MSILLTADIYIYKNCILVTNSIDPPAASNLGLHCLFICVEVLRPSQPSGVMLSTVSLLTTLLLARLSPLSG